MEETPLVQSEPKPALDMPKKQRRGLAGTTVLSFVAGLVGVAAIGASAWVYAQTQRDIVRISTDIAQIRLSLELFGRQQGTPSTTDTAALQDLSNRLSVLEESWREAPAAATSSLPAIAAPEAAPTSAAASQGDCMPQGTRFLISAGDAYPICGVAASIEMAAVDNGFVTLQDGTVIAAGGTIAMPGTSCMLGVVSAGENGMTGFAEIRVTC
ncbi:hypothetical protein [Devosia sp. 2618]|uniref:hypothetical protein n=1 Tax=Devosia sp. 2618 TaxID=3156454 RepID=UPI003399F1F8